MKRKKGLLVVLTLAMVLCMAVGSAQAVCNTNQGIMFGTACVSDGTTVAFVYNTVLGIPIAYTTTNANIASQLSGINAAQQLLFSFFGQAALPPAGFLLPPRAFPYAAGFFPNAMFVVNITGDAVACPAAAYGSGGNILALYQNII